MPYRKTVYFSLLFLLIIGAILAGIIFYARNQKLQVAFFDVGQGDAILISRDSQQILIDGGQSGQKLMEKLGEYVPFWDREIEVIISTHPDADHIGGLIDTLKNYTINQLIESGAKNQSQVFGAYEKIIKEKEIEKQIASRGMKIKIFDGAELEIFHPKISMENISEKDTNEASVVAKLSFGENSFLFTGDLPANIENQLMNDNLPLSANVLKVSHHGSKSATNTQFLDYIHPQEAIISVGKNNRYGHPATETLQRLQGENIKILRTDESGDAVYNCENINNKCKMETEF
ncbi:MAG TPA: hypothetical protein DCS28_00100 [Candidatus Moranbacteria bacterium]|nr:hypothetical protein [Candidatus Moranbacteria bacterium]HAT74436.1 hypothetical protein [Candidatus Moranbacteria bacterium]